MGATSVSAIHRPHDIRAWVAWALVALGLCGLVWFNHLRLVDGLLAAVLALLALLEARRRARRAAVPVLLLVVEVVWAASGWYPAYLVLHGGALAWGLALAGAGVWHAGPASWAARVARALGLAAVGLVGVLGLALLVTAVTPVPIIRALRHGFGAGNSFTAPASRQQAEPGGYRFTNDVQYASTYPNSFLDVFTTRSAGRPLTTIPTVVIVHGGGFTWGDKGSGDPNAGSTSAFSTAKPFLDAGWNVVSLNYALAPEYKYPTPIRQMSQAMTFLQSHAAQYGIGMDKVVLLGGSAGGQLVGQFANIQTNPAYAREMGMAATLPRNHLAAVVFNSALLDDRRFSKTGTWTMDYLFLACGRAYFGGGFLKGADVDQSNVITHLTSNFPPSYISDGNHATFYTQAFDLRDRMQQLGVPHMLTWYPPSVARLFHGYESGTSPQAAENQAKELTFLKGVLR